MPDARQGDIHWYDFGPVIGAELSSRRPALVISNDDFNRAFGVAIAIPMSRTMPAEERRPQHIYISVSNSWASAWQMKSIDQDRLGDRIGRASPDEMDDVLGSLLLRLNRRHDPGWIQTVVGLLPIGAGSVWDLTLTDPNQDERQVSVLILDYNAGNGMAITVEVVLGEPRPGSPVAVPITIMDTGAAASARANIVRAIDASERDLAPANIVRPADVDAVIDRLLEWL